MSIPLGSASSASTLSSLRLELPLLVKLARERLGGALAEVDRSAGAERPAVRPRSRPSRRGGPPASGRPRCARRRARSGCRRRPRAGAAPSAPAEGRARSRPSSSRQPASRVAIPSCAGEPRSRSPSTAASACRSTSAGGSKALVAPARLDLVRLPGPAREDAGPVLTTPRACGRAAARAAQSEPGPGGGRQLGRLAPAQLHVLRVRTGPAAPPARRDETRGRPVAIDAVGLASPTGSSGSTSTPELVAAGAAHQRVRLRLALAQRHRRQPPHAGQAVVVVGPAHEQHARRGPRSPVRRSA